jgi:hypothetical protein
MKVMDNENKNDAQYCACVWCGNWISKDTYLKRVERKRDYLDICKDCLDIRKGDLLANNKKVARNHKTLGRIFCRPYEGELNEDWLPIDDEGKLFMPGHRICGAKDCVNSNHVIPPKKPEVSDIDLILMSMEVRSKHRKTKAK